MVLVRLMEQFTLDPGQKVRTNVIVFLNSAQITKGRERRRRIVFIVRQKRECVKT